MILVNEVRCLKSEIREELKACGFFQTSGIRHPISYFNFSVMPTLHLTTFIAAPVERVFDLSRNISLHKISMQPTGEQAIAGTTSGLINLDDTVTWKAKHLFKTRFFTSKVVEMKLYEKFTDKMIKGDFLSFQHEHFFKPAKNGTIAIDIIHFETPYGLLGKLVNQFYLNAYLEKLIINRNEVIRQYAEGEKWRALLHTHY
jgi:ligand-binding SRPBCC domain-containing protein